MAVFEYRALDKNGRETKGIIDASSVEEAREKLKMVGVHPI